MKNTFKKGVDVDTIHGISIPDPFRALENSDDQNVQKWIDDMNIETYHALKNDNYDKFSAELIKNSKIFSFGTPVPVNGRYFYMERAPEEEQAVLYMKKGLDGKAVTIFNPNGKREGNTVSIDFWTPSRNGKHVAYGISEGGDEMSTLHIKDVDNNKELSDKITNCRYSSIAWLPDDSGFFYTRNPRPGTVPKNEMDINSKVYFHKLGENSDDDQLIFGNGRPKDDMISLSLTLDGRYLGLKVMQKWTESEIYIYDTVSKETKALVKDVPAYFSIVFASDKVLLYTNFKANNNRVLWNSYEKMFEPIEKWQEFIAERKYALESVNLTKSKIIGTYLENACSKIVIFDYNGKEVGLIPLAKYSSLDGLSTSREEEEFFYGVDSFVFPKIIFHYDPVNSKYEEYEKIDNPINPDDFEVKQEWCTSKDGTKVPMFIFHKKGIVQNGLNPTILYGYGGFGSNQIPGFMRNWVPWLMRNGIFAIANIRGGGEFGDMWHKQGIKENKQNSFDDFIAAAEHLISKKYTDRSHLGICGGSNGGLLVSAVAVQRPNLFKAVCARVPLIDMVRFPKFGMALRWVHEYGNPEILEDLKRILTWSPYHNVKNGVKYPDFFVTTANKDTRVHPMHARKMTAMLRDANADNKAYLFTETEAGHGSGKPIKKIVESQAMILSFFAGELGMKV